MMVSIIIANIPVLAQKRQIILLKADDVLPTVFWKRFTDYIVTQNLKAGIGVVAKNLEDEALSNWLRTIAAKPQFEIWNHGYNHFCGDDSNPGEFLGTSYDDQLIFLKESQRLIREKLGVLSHVFGTPCNYKDNNTSRALLDIDEIHTWYYGRSDTIKLFMARKGNIEMPTGKPNFDYFTRTYEEDNLAQYDYLVLQLHPGWWGEELWIEFKKIIAFLRDKNVVFMNPSEYYESVTRTFIVRTTADGAPGSLREAVGLANKESGDAVIILPAGTYVLSGETGEDGNAGGDLDIKGNTIIKAEGSSPVVIDGGGKDRVFHIFDGRVILSGLIIRNGQADLGGGIRIDGGTAAIIDCTITGNTVKKKKSGAKTGGAGIYIDNAKVTVSRCRITGNKGDSSEMVKGGGIWVDLHDRRKFFDMRNSIVQDNSANTHATGNGRGGGLYLNIRGAVYETSIYHNEFNRNIADNGNSGFGGGLFIETTEDTQIERNRFENNRAASGGGASIFGKATAAFTGNLFAGNHASVSGGGMYIEGGSVSQTASCTLTNNTLASNLPSQGQNGGEGVYVSKNVSIELYNNLIAGNRAGIKLASGAGSVIADNNLFFNAADPVIGDNAIRLDPKMDINYGLRSGSPAIDAGKKKTNAKIDLAGIVRPLGKGYDIGCFEHVPGSNGSALTIDREELNFVWHGAYGTGSQTFGIDSSGGESVNWTVNPGRSWIKAGPTAGSGSGVVTVKVNPNGLTPGEYSSVLTVKDRNSQVNNREVDINLVIYSPGATSVPFGSFDTPIHGTLDVNGSIPVTGWALDDIKVKRVEICYRRYENQPLNYIGDAIFVAGARPDVEERFPGYPDAYRAGWGYMLLTNMLPLGDGDYSLYARLTDVEGNTVLLGPRTISVDNTNAVKPYGALDTPMQGGIVSGTDYVNFGWALTPRPNYIEKDGSTIDVWVDGIKLGHPVYNVFRSDIAQLFPGYFNSQGAIGYFVIDTTGYSNGVHTIQWTVTDSGGNKEGIGSRYFTISNTSNISSTARTAATAIVESDIPDFLNVPLRRSRRIETNELERVVISFDRGIRNLNGYSIVNGRLRSLPAGITCDPENESVYWLPGPGFLGVHELMFFIEDNQGNYYREELIINIVPYKTLLKKSFSTDE